MVLSRDRLQQLMSEAISQARAGAAAGEVPVGALLVIDDRVVARAHNLVERNHDPTAHAEILVIREAAASVADWRLNNALLVVTLEPCPMCISALKLARVGTVVFGVADPRMGACGSIYDLSQEPRAGSVPRIISGIQELECREVLRGFFEGLRK